MSKPLLGLLLGSVLGILDGITGFFSPQVAPIIFQVIIITTIKGVISGVAIGLIARKVRSLPLGILAGLGIGAALSYLVALAADPSLYLDIILPGAILGLIVGFATQKYGRAPEAAEARR